jgi:hypothetical protein
MTRGAWLVFAVLLVLLTYLMAQTVARKDDRAQQDAGVLKKDATRNTRLAWQGVFAGSASILPLSMVIRAHSIRH